MVASYFLSVWFLARIWYNVDLTLCLQVARQEYVEANIHKRLNSLYSQTQIHESGMTMKATYLQTNNAQITYNPSQTKTGLLPFKVHSHTHTAEYWYETASAHNSLSFFSWPCHLPCDTSVSCSWKGSPSPFNECSEYPSVGADNHSLPSLRASLCLFF